MLRRLRWQLTAFYFLAALGLVALLGAGSYALLYYYLQSSTDLALQYKMATQFRQYGLAVPSELAQAELAFLENKPRSTPTLTSAPAASSTAAALASTPNTEMPSPTAPVPTPRSPTGVAASGEGEGDGEDGSSGGEAAKGGVPTQGTTPVQEARPTSDSAPAQAGQPAHEAESGHESEAYDSELSPVFVIPLDQNRQRIPSANLSPAPVVQDAQASLAAIQTGSDLRTSLLADGSRVRLLTYRVSVPGGPALLQAGRLLGDQDRLLRGFLIGLLVISGLSIALLGVGSWWLSGRSLGPAQRAWDQQQAFISNASHELRTPLTLIRASAEYALRSETGSEGQALLGDILQESDYMNRLVDDLLLLSRLDAHRLKLDRIKVDLPHLLEEARRQAEKLAEGRGIRILLSQADGAVRADPLRLRQVLLILLDNAVRFTPPGGTIQLEARPLGRLCEIRVADTGRGIPPEHMPHLFERFYQVPGAASQAANSPAVGEATARSNGLGLSIAKALVEAQGGSIHLQSQVGQGTVVVITLPAVSAG